MGRWYENFKHALLGCSPDALPHFDGLSFSARCRVCGRRCLQDSYGQWFAIGDGQRPPASPVDPACTGTWLCPVARHVRLVNVSGFAGRGVQPRHIQITAGQRATLIERGEKPDRSMTR